MASRRSRSRCAMTMFIASLPAMLSPAVGLGGPADIPGLVLRLDAEETHVTKDADNSVATWSDITDTANNTTPDNVAQSDSDRRPRWVDEAINGLPAIRFDGDDFLNNTANNLVTAGSARSVFLVGRLEDRSTGMIEIWSDERPWKGTTPWMNRAIRYDWRIAGRKERLACLEDRFPSNVFKQYWAAVKNPAAIYRRQHTAVLELGESTVNGRRWNRRLYLATDNTGNDLAGFAEVADEGFIVQVDPVRHGIPVRTPVDIVYPETARVPAETLADVFEKANIPVSLTPAAENASEGTITFQLLDPGQAEGIRGNGFAIHPREVSPGITVSAETLFGLVQASQRLAQHVRIAEDKILFPLIAENPAVDVRATCVGGAPRMGDFYCGTEDEWKAVFDELIASGQNAIGCMGMWGNWKMPVKYKHMPELASDAPDAYDEAAGARLLFGRKVRRVRNRAGDLPHRHDVPAGRRPFACLIRV